MAFAEARSLLRPNIPTTNSRRIFVSRRSSSSEDWSDSSYSGSSGSDNSSDDSCTVEWESHVGQDGSLFYLEYNIQPAVKNVPNIPANVDKTKTQLGGRGDLKRSSTRRCKKPGIRLSSLINGGRKSSYNENTAKTKTVTGATRKTILTNRNDMMSGDRDTTTKVKFNEMAGGEVKEITVFIDPAMRHKYGRRTSVSEALLGVSVCPFPDSSRIMIAGYMPNSEISQDKAIKIGDWLKSINNQDINVENFELILLSFIQPTYIKLQLQRIAVEEPPQHHPNIAKVTNTNEFVDTLRSFFPSNRHSERDHVPIFSLLLLSLNDNNGNSDDVIFSYPSKEFNYLYNIRGTFVTMHSLFRECTFNSRPKVSCVTIQSVEYYVSYYSGKDELLLVAIPAKRTTLQDSKFKLNAIVRCLEISATTISKAFFTNDSLRANEEHRNFAIEDICAINKLLFSLSHSWNARFEDILLEPQYVVLPREGEMRVEDALNEMEAMDYREWNNDPLKSVREFYILGSALYFRKYLISSHLSKADLLDVEAFLRTNGIYLLIENKPVRELIVWREIFPTSCNPNIATNIIPNPLSRWFLTIVARNQLILAVILESRHRRDSDEPTSSSTVSNVIGPSRFYIDEIQDTLDHLHSMGIENLTSTSIYANKRPETLLLKEGLESGYYTINSTTQNASCNVINVSGGHASASGPIESLTAGFKNTEIISILKRRNNSTENVNENLKYTTASGSGVTEKPPSIHSQTYSDTSLQRYDVDIGDDDDDEDDDDDDESDSDWEALQDSQQSSSGFDISDMASTLYREIADVPPVKVTAGKQNVLYHFVQLETGEGIIFAPPSTHSANIITYAFYKTCLHIHNILQNSIRFRHLLSQEASTHSMNRSLVAVKEHGVLITDELNTGYQPFWVIGRLFMNPSKEVYICHRADVPQNIVEVAYRLMFQTCG